MSNHRDEISKFNFALLLAAYIESNGITVRRVAKAIGCSEPTLGRLLTGKTTPTDEALKQGSILMEIGHVRYEKLTDSEKEKLSEKIGTCAGGALGFGTVTAAVSSFGITGLSAAGITSGLAGIGGLVGGGMAAGILVAAALPAAGLGIGYTLIRGVKYFIEEKKLSSTELDLRWEELPEKSPS